MDKFKLDNTNAQAYELDKDTQEWGYLGTFKQIGITDAMLETERQRLCESYSKMLEKQNELA